jgi:uncharacterized small protein (DUF1192 family)
MDWDDDKPRPPRVTVVGEKLDDWSVADLEQRVRDLEGEIGRVRGILTAKKLHTAAADALFKK